MVAGAFPSLTSVKEIREFDGSIEKLANFLASVDAHLAAYNLPLETGGIVEGDTDEGWTYVSAAEYTANTDLYKMNYNYGQCFCTLLAERFIGSAHKWWINCQNASSIDMARPNC
jgi:hypothetical protein